MAIGGAAALTGVAAVAAKGVLSIFGGNWNNIISGSIEGSMEPGRSFLNKLMSISLL